MRRRASAPADPYLRRLVVALLTASCAGASDSPGVAVRDSAGVTIVESTIAAWDREPPWRVSAEPTLVIGGAEHDVNSRFHEVAGVVRLRSGGVVVADGGSASILFYDAGGRFLRRVGGRGSGPGEFRRISSLQPLDGDSLLVFDGALARVTLLDAGGAIVAVHGFEDTAGEPVFEVARLADGRYVAAIGGSTSRLGHVTEPGIHRTRAPVVVFSSSGEPLDTVGTFPATEFAFTEIGGRLVTGLVPFGHALSIGVFGDEIHIGTSDVTGFEVFAPGGEHLRSIRAPGRDLALTDGDVEAFRSSYLAQAPDADLRRALIEYLDIVIGTDHVLGRWADDLGVESVRMYTLERS